VFHTHPRARAADTQFLRKLKDEVADPAIPEIHRKDLLARYHVCAVLVDRSTRGRTAVTAAAATTAAVAGGSAPPLSSSSSGAGAGGGGGEGRGLRSGSMAAAEIAAMKEITAKDAEMDAAGLRLIDSLVTLENLVGILNDEVDSQHPLIKQVRKIGEGGAMRCCCLPLLSVCILRTCACGRVGAWRVACVRACFCTVFEMVERRVGVGKGTLFVVRAPRVRRSVSLRHEERV
jgi:hypothetical protein